MWHRRMRRKAAKTARPCVGAVRGCEWTQTEKRYFYGVLGGVGAYEGAELRITPDNCEKHIYTPDFVTKFNGGREYEQDTPVYHEVKGTYRLESQDAARLRWCFAAIAHPHDIFVWAKETKRHDWDIEVWYDGGRVRVKERGVKGFKFNERGGVIWVK